MTASIVIPFYNERESLNELLPRLSTSLKGLQSTYEVLLVDDGSTDGSGAFAASFFENHFSGKLITNSTKSGQTECYRKAFTEASGNYIIRMDADLQDSPEDLPLFENQMNSGADLVMGLREARKHRRIIRLASLLYDILIVALFNSPLHSNSGSFVCFKTVFVKNIPWQKNDHRYIPLIAMHRGAKDIREVIVRHSVRKFGVSNYKPLFKVFAGVPEVLRFLFRLKRGFYSI